MEATGEPVDDAEFATVLSAAILHDVGHAPFSHALEQVLGIRHEKISAYVVGGDTAVNTRLLEYGGQEFVTDVTNHITDAADDRTISIISSQLDADRADYILRDGYFAGVPNAHFDLERIILKSRLDDRGLLFDQSAEQAIEGYFIARYHLYRQLYFHRTVRSAEALMRSIIKRARDVKREGGDLGEVGPGKALFDEKPDIEIAARLTDAELWTAFRLWASSSSDKILQDLSSRLINRVLFQTVLIPAGDVFNVIDAKVPEIREVAKRKDFNPEYYVLTDAAKDTPYKITDPGMGEPGKAIRLRDRTGTKVISLETSSGIIKALQDEAYQIVRICFPKELSDDVFKIIDG
jgi:HD superfamily phosphohydrolase